MSVQRRCYLFLMTLATAAAMPALGQAVASDSGGTQTTASIPDFLGT
jgi:hypothetical protein